MPPSRPPVVRQQAETLLSAINARDFDAVARTPWLDPEFEFHSALSATEGRHHVGAPGLREWAAEMDSVWADFRIELTDWREVPDGRILVLYRVRGRARGSGIPLDARTAQVWTLRDGRLWHNQSFADPAEAFEAVGLRE